MLGLFAGSTGPSPCRYDRQYLNLVGGDLYVQILDSSGDAPWWYMVPVTALPKLLSRGGWAPPTYFEPIGETIDLYEVPLHELKLVSDQSAEEGVAAPLPCDVGCIRVSVDGSADDRRGIAAGCLAIGVSLTMRASLALPGITGAESSELLGIVLGLWVCCQSCRMHSRFVLLVDRANGLKYVFQNQDPSEADGWDLWPAIVLARKLVSLLRELNIQVSAEKVVSRQNLAHHIAKSEMRYRRDRGWRPHEERWPEALPYVFREVWHEVARSRRGESMDTGARFFSKGYKLSDDVLSALDSIARGVAQRMDR